MWCWTKCTPIAVSLARMWQMCCAGCGAPLFTSETKYESGSGWPSFYAPIEEAAIATQVDDSAGMRRIEAHGPFQIHGDKDMMEALDALLRAFVAQRRMKISGQYRPCYEVVT